MSEIINASATYRRWSEFESAGAVGIEMLKFEAKKGDFAKIWQKLGPYQSFT